MAGIDTVTPDTEVSSSGGDAVGDTGLSIGGANLIPLKLDIGIQNFPLSDFAAWPNPVTLANNAAALTFPTYIIRGLDATNASTSLAAQLASQIPNSLPTTVKPLSFNYYLTVPINGAPVLEPTYVAVDALNLLTGAQFNNLIGTALNPFLTSAGNLGYTDTVRDANGNYIRTFDDTGVPTAFFSFPDLNWTKVPADLANSLRVGVEQAVHDGVVNTGPPKANALKEVLDLAGSVTSGTETTTETTSFAPTSITETSTTRRGPILNLIKDLGNSAVAPKALAANSATPRATPVRDAAKRASDQVRKTVKDVSGGLKKAADDIEKVVKKVSDAAKPKASKDEGS